MTTLSQLKTLFVENRLRLSITYSLILAENVIRLFYPIMTGHAINTLLAGRYDGLLLFVVFWIVRMGTATWRRVYDTKTFTRVYANLATRVVTEQHNSQVPVSNIIARSTLSKEFVDFFERDTPLMVRTSITLVGSVIILFSYHLLLGALSLALILPLTIINYFNAKRSLRLNTELNNELEQEVEVISGRNVDVVRNHYLKLSHWRVKLSNFEAGSFSIMEVFILAFFAAALVLSSRLPGIQAGTIFAILKYVDDLIDGLDSVPTLVLQVSRLRDIARRMRLDAAETL
jgi:ABC-type multidrug transport system fused ATPase/permease subunit